MQQHATLPIRPTLAAWTYQNAELQGVEMDALFRRSWQFACHVNELPQPRDFITLDMGPDPVLVLRDESGVLRAYLNVCRHRGARLLDGSGQCKARLTCPYHGWSYSLQGPLAARPSEDTFADHDTSALGLRALELEVLCGLVFVRLTPGGPALHTQWKEFLPQLQDYRLEEMVPLGAHWVEDWACNWKVGVDNNLENYHVPLGHPGYQRLLDSDMMGTINAHGVAGSTSVLRAQPSSNWAERMYQAMAPRLNADLPASVRKAWTFFTMPPNTGMDIYGDSMDLFQFFPKTATSCTVRYPIYVRPDSRREMKVLRYLNARINRQVSAQDKTLSERVQQGLQSQGFANGPLSRYEHCIEDFHRRVQEACPVTRQSEEPAPGFSRAA